MALCFCSRLQYLYTCQLGIKAYKGTNQVTSDLRFLHVITIVHDGFEIKVSVAGFWLARMVTQLV